MGIQRKINQANKEAQKKEILSQPGMEVFADLQEFYRLHPTSTAAVRMEVQRIREESEAFSVALQQKFEAEHGRLIAEYLRKELDYVRSYLSPDQLEKETGKKPNFWKRILKS